MMKALMVLIGSVVMVILPCAAFQPSDLVHLLPKEIRGWRWDGKDEIYDPQTIFRYIDGMGEVYRAYNFRFVLVRCYDKPDQPRLTVDFFDMGSSEDAFGIFSFEREGNPVGVGQDSDYAVGMLRFWKGRYFVTVMAERETPETKETVLALGKAIAAAISEEGRHPEVLGFLPQKGLLSQSILFFRHPTILNHHFFLADKDILNLSPKVEGVLATYQIDKAKVRLIIVRYPTEKDAVKAQATFGKAYLREGRLKGIVRTENKKWTAARRWGKILAVVFDATTKKQAIALLAEAGKRMSLQSRSP